MKNTFLLLLFSALVYGQETVAPVTDQKVGPTRGENLGDYNIVQQWEFGYRTAAIGGNADVYRADVNFRSGVSLLGSSLTMNSKTGHGKYFDEIVFTTQGLGSDPYGAATLRVRKNELYEYNSTWRQNNYFNPALTVSNGLHLMDTQHRWQDHDLLLFPHAKIRIKAGYSRVGQTGPALSTEQLFDSRGDVLPVFRNIKREYNEYRVGGDVEYSGFRLSVLRRWEFFKEDTTDNVGYVEQVNTTVLTHFARSEPNHGYTSSWTGNLFGERKWFSLNAHINYSGGTKNFFLNENAIGTDRFGGAQNRQVFVGGTGSRPLLAGDFNFTLFPASKLTIVNNTSVSNLRIAGNSNYSQYDLATFSYSELDFQFLGIRLITNSTDARYKFTKKFDVFGGFRYSDRLIRSDVATATPGFPYDSTYYEQTNTTKAGAFGFNWMPVQHLRIHAEGEIGRSDNPFTPVSEKNYHGIKARVQYRTKTFTASAGYTENYNNNSIVLTSYASHSRNYSADTSWQARPWLSFDGSYSKLHLDTVGGIAFFAGTTRSTYQSSYESIFISNIHAVNVGARFALGKRADLCTAYSITKDTGDGRSALSTQSNAIAQVLYNVQTFPLSFQSPLARLSVKISPKLRWNLGYQWYGYHEQFGVLNVNQNYRAHTGFTSLLWAF